MGDARGRRTRAKAVVAALAVVAGILLAAGPAVAQSVSSSELQGLARRAVDDPRALAQLRSVRQVEGVPVDLGQALGGAEGPALAARLRALAEGGSPRTVPAADARQAAEDVLDGRRFQPARVPRPLAGVLRTIGGWLRPVAGPVGRLWARVSDSLPAQLGAVAVVFVLALAITARLVGRRSPQSLSRAHRDRTGADELDPDELEREALAAERAGDLGRAVRLRFVAGVLRLDREGVLPYRSSLTTGQLAARLRSESFAELAAAFDEIVYGGRPAGESDVETARTRWPRVLAEARR